MDLSTLISPLLNLASAVKSYGTDVSRGDSKLTMAALDRTLGTVASLGLTIGLYRVLKELREEYRDGPNGARTCSGASSSGKSGGSLQSIQSLIQALVRSIMMGLGIKRLHLKSNHSTRREDDPAWATDKLQIRTFSGTCHCKSVSFILRAPSHIEARECNGKIKYPHCVSSANDFQLITGSKFLSVYYVDLCNFETSVDRQHFKHSVIAAHTFCSRCGVHILRAPNSHTHRLEVNTNCLDDFKNMDGRQMNENSFISINVTFDDSHNWMAMGEGKPVRDVFRFKQQQQLEEQEEHPFEDQNYDFRSYPSPSSTYQSYHRKDTLSPWSAKAETKAISEKDYEGSRMQWTQSESQDSTPATLTTSTPGSGSCISSTTHDTDSLGDSPSFEENFLRPFSNPGYGLRSDESASISGWPVASSLQSLAPTSHERTTGMPHLSANKEKLRPSSLMKDQVKYYMNKHMKPKSRQDTDMDIDNKNLDK